MYNNLLTSKQRAKLRSIANSYETILQVGKSGISEMLIKQTDDALIAREMIKMRVLDTSPESAKETADKLAAATKSDVVQVIGTRFVLYRENPEKKLINIE